MLDVLWTSCSDVVAAVTLRTSRVRIKTWGLNTNVVLCRHEDYFRTCHFFRKPHTSFLWQVGAQKVISSSCCWSKTHLLERVPSKSFKLQILVWFVDFIGTFLGALCRVWCRIPLRKKAKCKQRSWCHGVIQRLFQSVNGGDGKWDVVRGMWLVSLKTWKMFCWCSRFRKLPELNSLILIFALTERFALSSWSVWQTTFPTLYACFTRVVQGKELLTCGSVQKAMLGFILQNSPKSLISGMLHLFLFLWIFAEMFLHL